MDRSRIAAIDGCFADLERLDGPGAALAVVEGGEVTYTRGYGAANLEHQVPVAPQTVFHVASVSKQFTGFALALLESEGVLSLDDPVRRHVAEVPEAFGHITLAHLAHHTSGLRDQWEALTLGGWRMDDVISTGHILKFVSRQQDLNFDTGSEHLYCNTGYTLMAEAVTRTTGTPFPEWMRERVFEPLGMGHTHFHDDHERLVPNRADSYFRTRDGITRKSVLSYANCGATSLHTTVLDLAKWIGNLRDQRVGGREAFDRLVSPACLNDGQTVDYGLGVALGEHRGARFIGHSGGDAGYRSHLVWFPEPDLGVVVLSNSAQAQASALALEVAGVARPDAFEPETGGQPEAFSVPREALEAFEGLYAIDGAPGPVRVTAAGRMLVARVDGMPDLMLVPTGAAEFASTEPAMTLRFDDGAVHVDFGGAAMSGRRIEDLEIDAAGYVGDYFSEELRTEYRLIDRDGALVATHVKHDDIPLLPLGEDLFAGSTFFFSRARFERNDAGEVRGLLVSGGRCRDIKFTKR